MNEPRIMPADMRQSMGQFATGVTVITGRDEDGPVGFACQSFASVSLTPALVLFCADHGSRTWPRLRRAGRFTVNVLAEDQTDLVQRFGSRTGAKFEGLEVETSPFGTPSLPDVLMRVHADVLTVHTAGDHDVVIGSVLGLENVRPERPMLFFSGQFGLPQPALV